MHNKPNTKNSAPGAGASLTPNQVKQLVTILETFTLFVPPERAYVTLTEIILQHHIYIDPAEIKVSQTEDVFFMLKLFAEVYDVLHPDREKLSE